MKLFLLSLNTLFLLSCDVVPLQEDNEEGENSKIESIKSQAKTALAEMVAFQKEVESIKSLLVAENAGNPNPNLSNKMKTIASLENSLPALKESADQSYTVLEVIVVQAERAVDEAEVEQAVKQAISAKDKIVSFRNQVEEIRNRVKTLAAVKTKGASKK